MTFIWFFANFFLKLRICKFLSEVSVLKRWIEAFWTHSRNSIFIIHEIRSNLIICWPIHSNNLMQLISSRNQRAVQKALGADRDVTHTAKCPFLLTITQWMHFVRNGPQLRTFGEITVHLFSPRLDQENQWSLRRPCCVYVWWWTCIVSQVREYLWSVRQRLGLKGWSFVCSLCLRITWKMVLSDKTCTRRSIAKNASS